MENKPSQQQPAGAPETGDPATISPKEHVTDAAERYAKEHAFDIYDRVELMRELMAAFIAGNEYKHQSTKQVKGI